MLFLLGLAGLPPWSTTGFAAEESRSPSTGGKQFSSSDGYVHNWLTLPPISGVNPLTGETITYKTRPGRIAVVVFLASWCVPCQLIAPSLHDLELQYNKLDTDFIYVFSHDTTDDVEGFAKEYKLGDYILLGNDQILKDYHTPPLPSFYFADRHGWLTARDLKLDKEKLTALGELLKIAAIM